MNEKHTNSKIKSLEKLISNSPKDIELLFERAELFTSIQQHGNAINDYLTILKIVPDNKIAKTKLELLRTIIKYSNIDIYASTNTNMDPWED